METGNITTSVSQPIIAGKCLKIAGKCLKKAENVELNVIDLMSGCWENFRGTLIQHPTIGLTFYTGYPDIRHIRFNIICLMSIA